MAIDTPAKIAIVGAGPIGLEATLYARFLGYDVQLYEAREVCGGLARHRQVKLFHRFGELSSPLGRSAIVSQVPDHRFPPEDAWLTVGEWCDVYLQPLSQVDLVIDSIRSGTEVRQIGREGYRRSDLIPFDDRFDELLLVRLRHADGTEDWQQSDIVIDAGGTSRDPAGWGLGGLMPIGAGLMPSGGFEFQEKPPELIRFLRPVGPLEREAWQGKHLVVIGGGDSAAYQLSELLALRQQFPETTIDWIVRCTDDDTTADHLAASGNDSPLRAKMLRQIDQGLAEGALRRHTGLQVAAVRPADPGWWIDLVGSAPNCIRADVIFALTGYRPDTSIQRELQLALSPITEGPIGWADHLDRCRGDGTFVIGDVEPNPLITTEPNFYVIGAKSFGRVPGFTYRIGLDQIRALFALIADRPGLDLYSQLPLAEK